MSTRIFELLAALKKEEPIYIIGHDNPDVDSTIAGILLAKLLNFLGYQAEFKILQKVKKKNSWKILMELTDIDMTEYEEEIEDESYNLILVDHYNTSHAGEVLACIDHHPTYEKNTYPFSYVRNCTAAAYMVYELMKEANYPIKAVDVKHIIIAMMVDTISFKSSKAIPEEAEVAKTLAEEFGLNYEYLEHYCFCLTPIGTMSAEEIICNGQKKYNYNGNKVVSAYVQIYGMPKQSDIEEWIFTMRFNCLNKDTDMYVFLIFDLKAAITHEYRVCGTNIEKFSYNGILSRGLDIMPKIEKLFL